MSSLFNPNILMLTGGCLFILAVFYAFSPNKHSKEFNHLLSCFRAQQDSLMKMRRDLEELKGMDKKIEWLEVKLNAKSEVHKYALPHELRVVVERKPRQDVSDAIGGE